MQTLTEMEATLSRILSVLEHDDLRNSSLVTLSDTLARLRRTLDQRLVDWRAKEDESPEVRSIEEGLQTMAADVLWLQDHAGVKPLMEVSQKLRMTCLRALRIVTMLQHGPAVTGPRSTHLQQRHLIAP